MKRFLLLTLLTFTTLTSFSQVKYEDLVTKFFKTFETDPVTAYENLFKDNKWVGKDDIEKNKIDFRSFLTDLGDYSGYELVVTKTIGDSYILKSYLAKFERQPLRIILTFYKPKNDWVVYNFSYDTSFDEELEDGAKYDRLPATPLK